MFFEAQIFRKVASWYAQFFILTELAQEARLGAWIPKTTYYIFSEQSGKQKVTTRIDCVSGLVWFILQNTSGKAGCHFV